MAITLLYGSMSKNITDIVKGGGCPKIKPPNKNMSVIRYFSKVVLSTHTGEEGVCGDGGHYNQSGVSPYGSNATFQSETSAAIFSQFFYEAIGFNFQNPYATLKNGQGTALETFHETSKALNISNQKEVAIYANGAGTVQNIELANDVIEKDGSGYYNYDLYKANQTRSIINASTQLETSQTGELMEFVYLHTFLPKCREGDIYLELHDFDLTGTTTNDYLIYFYYWESTRDNPNIGTALLNTELFASSSGGLLLTPNNVLVKCVKASELKGTGTNKKLIIWLNRLKTKGEKFGVNVAIGFSPQEVRKDEFVYLYSGTNTHVTNDPISDIVFKFKNAIIKTKKTGETINCTPICYPSYAFKNLEGSTFNAVTVSAYKIKIQLLNSSNQPVNNIGATGATGTHHGPKNGGADASQSWITEAAADGRLAGLDQKLGMPSMHFADGILSQFTMTRFYICNTALVSGQTYTMRMPNFTDLFGQKISQGQTSFSYSTTKSCFPYDPVTRTGYMDVYDSFPTDYTIKVYAGDEPLLSGGQAMWQTMLDSLVLLKTFTAAELGASFVEINSGSAYELASAVADSTSLIVGSPYYHTEKAYIKKNKYRYFTFDGGVLPLYPCHFYIVLCKDGIDIKNISYGVTVDTSEAGGDPAYYYYYPTGFGSPMTTYVRDSCGDAVSSSSSGTHCTYSELAGIDMSPEYSRVHDDGVLGGGFGRVYKNYGASIFKAPQIIDKSAQPTAENYYDS